MFKLREEVERCVLEAAQSTGSSLLGDHYRDELASWFEGPADLWTHFRSRHAAGAARLRKIDALARYTSDAERPYHAELRKLTERKIALDQHYALQLVLKYWAFVHVPLTGALLVLVALHVLVAHAFSGGS
jgi:hypothetical protein